MVYISLLRIYNIHRTYLLGQNIPLTTEELAAREVKRQKAMELQEAIKQQVNRPTILICNYNLL